MNTSQMIGLGGSLQFPSSLSIRSTSHTPESSSAPAHPGLRCLPQAFTVISAARHSLHPHPHGQRPLTTPQTSLHAADRIFAPPCRASDAGLRPHPFPDEAASLLSGHLAATRTGLTPASDDEH